MRYIFLFFASVIKSNFLRWSKVKIMPQPVKTFYSLFFFSLSNTKNTSVEGVSSAPGTLEYGDARLCGEGSLNYAIKIRSGRLRLSLFFL